MNKLVLSFHAAHAKVNELIPVKELLVHGGDIIVTDQCYLGTEQRTRTQIAWHTVSAVWEATSTD